MGITDIQNRTCPGDGGGHYDYFFQVATRPLHIYGGGCSAKCNDTWRHHALFYDDEIFEFGPKGYKRRKNYNCDDRNEYTLDNEITGYSNLSPNELESKIKDNGNFNKSDYKMIKHNCQDFVLFCLKILDSDAAKKYTEKYRKDE